jgi:hypothetical protein
MAKAPAKRTMRDGLENLVTGMGTDRDKLSFTMFEAVRRLCARDGHRRGCA